MGFEGWRGDFQRFFIGLRMDNSKTYWEANKKLYQEEVRAPMLALLEELEPRFGKFKVFRPNRDTRFSADKSPYKTNIAASGAAGYVSLDAGGLFVGGGQYHLEPGEVVRLREAVADPRRGGELDRLVAGLEAGGFGVGGQDLKRVPRPYPADHPRARFLRHKRLYAYMQFEPAPWLATPAAADRVATALEAVKPLNSWLDRALAPAQMAK